MEYRGSTSLVGPRSQALRGLHLTGCYCYSMKESGVPKQAKVVRWYTKITLAWFALQQTLQTLSMLEASVEQGWQLVRWRNVSLYRPTVSAHLLRLQFHSRFIYMRVPVSTHVVSLPAPSPWLWCIVYTLFPLQSQLNDMPMHTFTRICGHGN